MFNTFHQRFVPFYFWKIFKGHEQIFSFILLFTSHSNRIRAKLKDFW